MNIECTKEEFKILLDLVYAGNVLINGMRAQEERIQAYSIMEQQIFAKAKEFELEDLITYDEEFREYMPTAAYEENGVDEYIDAYDTQVFWEELVMRLARRDALNYVGDVDQNMTKSKLKEMQMNLEEKYEEEFEESGLMHLKIVKQTEENL
ncbi:hypothetical protein [Cellulosilyticum sp. I15G10I2]|uniref:hypothetical protein n=1 Tax=Cellulosilyticum sp. I15G10I2 TaxID=1892843 RepID=UPI00085CD509|nr:hypothetical protein [Cellulosilyticum sp. I15G10I2]